MLRGIMPANPNMRNEKLRGVFEELGFENVQTVISSGNVIFDSGSRAMKELEAQIEEGIQRRLGFFSTTFIRSHEQLRRFVDAKPFETFEDTPTSRLQVTFLKESPRTGLQFPHRAEEGYTVLGIHDGELYSVVDLTGATTPYFMAWLEKQFGKEITTRTWKTVGRILSRMESGTR